MKIDRPSVMVLVVAPMIVRICCVSALLATQRRHAVVATATATATTTTTSQSRLSSLNAHSRREVLLGSIAASQLLVQTASAMEQNPAVSQLFSSQAPSTTLESGLLESRVRSNVLLPPTYGMEGPDIFYPEWFSGTWKVASETKEIQAPCGIALFGGNVTFINAQNDLGNILRYESRFLVDGKGRVIADREFNVKSIAKVALGENSVVDVSAATPNKFSCLLSPAGSPSMLTVDLIVLNRRQEPVSTYQFDCSEVVREIASPVDRPKQTPAILKEIETTSLYSYFPDTDQVRCRQRSAAFLLPSNENPVAMKMWQASGGRAIDVRFYDVTYTRI